MSETITNTILSEAKNAGDAVASSSIFNEMQDNICLLHPFDV